MTAAQNAAVELSAPCAKKAVVIPDSLCLFVLILPQLVSKQKQNRN